MKDETRLWLDSLSPSVDDVSVLQQHAPKSVTLSYAAYSGNILLLIALLRSNPSRTPRQIELFLRKAVNLAICHKRLDAVRFLMQYLHMECLQTLLCVRDKTCALPLHHAILQMSLPIVRSVFETHPSALHEMCENWRSPFQFAIQQDKYADIVHYFLGAMPDSIKEETLNNVFHFVSSSDMATRLHQLDPILIDQLFCEHTAAFSALWHNNHDVLRFILHLRPNQMTPELLSFAAMAKDIDVIELMLSLKPNFLGTDRDKSTVLHIVAKHIHKPQLIADVLVHCSHYLEQCDLFNFTPYKLAICADNQHAMDAYEQHLSVDVVFDTCTQSTPNFEANMARICLKVQKQCMVLDTLLLPELNAIVQSYIKT